MILSQMIDIPANATQAVDDPIDSAKNLAGVLRIFIVKKRGILFQQTGFLLLTHVFVSKLSELDSCFIFFPPVAHPVDLAALG